MTIEDYKAKARERLEQQLINLAPCGYDYQKEHLLSFLDSLIDDLAAEVRRETLEERDNQWEQVIAWLDGSLLTDPFPQRQEGEGAYWWRKPLREKVIALRSARDTSPQP